MSRLCFFVVFVACIAPLPASLAAQTTQTITPQDIAHHIGVIAHDSMRTRDTPSSRLELTAQYIADQFQLLGLTPGGDSGGWFQRYPLPLSLDLARSRIVFTAGGKTAVASFTTAVRLADPLMPARHNRFPAALVAGTQVPLPGLAVLHDKIVLYVDQPGIDSAARASMLHYLRMEGPGVIVLSDEDSATFAGRLPIATTPLMVHRSDAPPDYHMLDWMVHLRPDAVAGLGDVLAAAGVNLVQIRADQRPASRRLRTVEIAIEPQFDTVHSFSTTARNVIGILEGSDPKLKNEYILLSAHMDYRGPSNGADDNASGMAGLVALAKAFSQPGARPQRSLVFLATSGGTNGFSGSRFFAERIQFSRVWTQNQVSLQQIFKGSDFGSTSENPPKNPWAVPPGIRAAINLDMIGRGRRDSVTIDGMGELEVDFRLAWTISAHPELRLAVLDGGTAFRPRSDHVAFARTGVPSLYVHGSDHGDEKFKFDLPAAIDAEQAARITRLVFVLTHAIANSGKSARFTLEARNELLKKWEWEPATMAHP